MASRFPKGSGDWTQYRRPDCKEVNFHFGRREPNQSYDEAMWEIEDIVEGELVKAQKNGCAYVMFIHGWSTSGPGKINARSVVRGFMRSPEATPLIVRSECIQHETIFRAKVRIAKRSTS